MFKLTTNYSMVAVHWWHEDIDWMDCLIIVSEQFKDSAPRIVQQAADDWFANTDHSTPYEDAVGNALSNEHIPYVIMWYPSDDRKGKADDEWNATLEMFRKNGMRIFDAPSY